LVHEKNKIGKIYPPKLHLLTQKLPMILFLCLTRGCHYICIASFITYIWEKKKNDYVVKIAWMEYFDWLV